MREIVQKTMLRFDEKADFVVFYAEFQHLAQNDIEKFVKVYYNEM